MRIAGIVAEFNPFHAGHKYLIDEVRRQGATHIVCCMSGSAVQRGELAITDKHTRARKAIDGGADLVVELPAPYSCSSAELFATSAVRILVQLGINILAFGSECDDPSLLKKAAEAHLRLPDSEQVRRCVTSGMSYPAAIAAAARELCGEQIAAVLSNPNSTLAVEYISALLAAPEVEIMPVKRIGAGHDSTDVSGLPSGKELRRQLLAGECVTDFEPVDPSAAERVIYYHLLTADKEQLMKLPELGEPLADRILKAAAAPPPTLGEFLLTVKNKSCTLARLRRSALHLTLGVEGSRDTIPEPPYIRVLAMNPQGREVLSAAHSIVPVSTSLKKLEGSSERAARICTIENRAVRLLQLCAGRFENEFSRRFKMS